MKRYIAILLFILTIIFVTSQNSISVPKRSKEPFISDLTVTTSSSHLLLFGMLKNGFSDEMIQGLHSGLPIHFYFFIELKQTDKLRKDKKIKTIKTRHIISYDTLKEIYKVELEESGKRFHTFDSLEEAQKSVNEINGLKVVELEKLLHDVSYKVRIKAELHKKTLPLGLHEYIPFISWWDVKTKWHDITFNI